MATRNLIAAGLWIVWLLPFALRSAGPRKKAVVKDTGARWGAILEGLACLITWKFTDPQAAIWRIVPGVVFGLAGVAAAWLGVSHLDKQWRFDAALNADHELVRRGPYAFVRHPIYAGLFAMLLSTGLLLARWEAVLAAIPIFLVGTEIRVRSEDRLLRSRFGTEFEAYSRRVSAYVPFIR